MHATEFVSIQKRLDLELPGRMFAMVCSDTYEGAVLPARCFGASSVPDQERLSALSSDERKHFLESVACHKDMLRELAKM